MASLRRAMNDDGAILDAIDKGLQILGESPRRAIWYSLEKDFNLDRHKLPEDVEAFENALKSFFGPGYDFLQSVFRHNLQESSGIEFADFSTLVDCIHALRKTSDGVSRASTLFVPNITRDHA